MHSASSILRLVYNLDFVVYESNCVSCIEFFVFLNVDMNSKMFSVLGCLLHDKFASSRYVYSITPYLFFEILIVFYSLNPLHVCLVQYIIVQDIFWCLFSSSWANRIRHFYGMVFARNDVHKCLFDIRKVFRDDVHKDLFNISKVSWLMHSCGMCLIMIKLSLCRVMHLD